MKRILILLAIIISCKAEKVNEKDYTQDIKSLLTRSEQLASNKKMEDARKNINKAIKLSTEHKNDIEIANCLFTLSKLEFKYGVPQIAELSFEKAKEIYKSKNLKEKIKEINAFGLELYKHLGKEDKVNEIIDNPYSK